MGSITYEEVYEAFWQCLENKGNTMDAMRFEIDAERKCRELCQELNNRTYRPSRSIVFISEKPVKREIFGAAFRDRVVDTVFARKIGPLLEQQYIDDNYSTRVGKGTLYGIRRVEQMVRECSVNYTRDCWVMKLDMLSYFMSLPKRIAYRKFERLIRRLYHGDDVDLVCWILHTIIYDRPELHCVRNSPIGAWVGLPPTKSLFNSDGRHGLPIGKVVSQMTALVFMDDLDHELTSPEWEGMEYGHYMDDMVFVSVEMELLDRARVVVDRWAHRNGVRRHPRKMYLQHYAKGVLFTGGMILPGRTYISNRTVGACIDQIERFNCLARSNDTYVYRHYEQFTSVMNSYLGMMRHFAAFNIVCKVFRRIGPEWYKVIYVDLKYKRYTVRVRKPYQTKTLQLERLDAELNYLFKTEKFMTEQEVLAWQENTGNHEFYMILIGSFMHAYGNGAFALARATGYRVMLKRRKAGNLVTTGFPIASLEQVRACIAAAGGELERIDDKTYLFRGIDGTPDDQMVKEPHCTPPYTKPVPRSVPVGRDKLQWLKDAIQNFNLSMSTPMDAMLFIGTLQQQLKDSDDTN